MSKGDWATANKANVPARSALSEDLGALGIGYIANHIGVPGEPGFGVGVCIPSLLPAGMLPMSGTYDRFAANYGTYQYADGSIMCWVPAFYYKWGTGANGLPINAVSVLDYHAFANVGTANAQGYALHRAFYDGGAVQPGVFVDKYQCSAVAGVASSVAMGKPVTFDATHNPASAITGVTVNQYYSALIAAKSRGASFFSCSGFIYSALAMLSYAHGQASERATYCAWYHATNNFPKGNNNNAFSDSQDTTVKYLTDGFAGGNCGLTGSGTPFAKTTHNGQDSGIADLNGNVYEVSIGLTANATNLFVLKTASAMKNITSGNTLATDAWGATGLAALYDDIGTTYGALVASSTDKTMGNATQVLSEAVSGTGWGATGLGLPLVGGVGGTNAFGNDLFRDYRPNDLCPLVGGSWANASNAGAWALALNSPRGSTASNVGFRAALYL